MVITVNDAFHSHIVLDLRNRPFSTSFHTDKNQKISNPIYLEFLNFITRQISSCHEIQISLRNIEKENNRANRHSTKLFDSSMLLVFTTNSIAKGFGIFIALEFHHLAEEFPTWMRSPELLALQHNLTFPESATASPVTLRRAHRCRRFSVDLSQMRSLRLFFADTACTSGQLVVASRESQYKILHFHHGGLDRLAATLHQWHQLLYPRQDTDQEETLPYRFDIKCIFQSSCNSPKKKLFFILFLSKY